MQLGQRINGMRCNIKHTNHEEKVSLCIHKHDLDCPQLN